MRTLYATIATAAVALISIASTEALSQKQPIVQGTNLKPGGVSSRNMELIDIVSLPPAWDDQFETIAVTYPVGSTSVTKQLIIAPKKVTSNSANDGLIHIVDVTDPRNANPDFLKLFSKGTDLDPEAGNIDFEYYQVYKDQNAPESGTYKGDVFLIAWVGDVLVTPTTADNLVNARFMIFNLTKACELRASGSSNTITVEDASKREVTSSNSSTKSPHVYLGYVSIDKQWRSLHPSWSMQHPHGLTVDAEAGLLIMTPQKLSAQFTSTTTFDNTTFNSSVIKSHIDCFDLTKLATTYFSPSVSDLQVLPRITQSGSSGPIELWYMGSNNAIPLARDVYAKKLSTGKVRLVIASTSGSEQPVFKWNSDSQSLTYDSYGGVLTADLDYTTSTAATYSNKRDWQYDADRDEPLSKTSPLSDWGYRICHTAVPFWHTSGTPYVLTADELANPQSNPIDNPSVNAITISGGKYEGGVERAYISPGNQDDRRIGAYMRVWKAEEGSSTGLELKSGQSSGLNNGALTYYDPLQVDDAIVPDDLYYGSRRTADATSSRIASTAAFGPTSSNKLGPVTIHRPYVIMPYDDRYGASYNNNDVFVSNYAQGVRVVNLKDVASSPYPVIEKGFFDFIPRISYDGYEQYFYMLASRGQTSYSSLLQYRTDLPYYWTGVLHAVPDFGPSRIGTNGTGTLPSDEKFIYALGWGEGKLTGLVSIPRSGQSNLEIPADASDIQSEEGRNWLPKGGYLILRYFDGKLGGTIKGYEGTGSTPRKWSRRPYQTINLQGDFDVERDVTIAAGACVQLIPAHTGDAGIKDVMRLSSSSGKKIIVEGTLNISLPETAEDDAGERALRADITIDVPIEIKSGGVVNVYSIKTGKKVYFKKSVVCSLGGTWKMHPGANVELYEKNHYCHGKFLIEGTSTNRVTFKGRAAAGGNPAQEGVVSGFPAYSGSPTSGTQLSEFKIHYADCENAFFDMKFFQTQLTTKEVLNSNFLRTIAAASKSSFVRIEKPWGHSSNPFVLAFNQIEVEGSTFLNTYAGTENPGYKGFGVEIVRSPMVSISESDFGNLFLGAIVSTSFLMNVSNCNFEDNVMGMLSNASLGQVCASDFTDNEFSSVAYEKSELFYYDNQFTGCVDGISSWTGGRHFLRNNDFGAYLYGLNAKATVLYLRDYVEGEQDYEFGRNDFQSPAATFQFPGWAAAKNVYDIVRGRFSVLYVDCGQNDFNANSTYHVYGNTIDGSFDASDNRWPNAGGAYAPRTNLGYTGTNFNTQEDPDPNCGLVEIESECGAPICPGIMNYNDLTGPSSTLYTAISTLNSDIVNTSYSVACRKAKAWELVAAVTRTDSAALRVQVKSTLNTVATNTALTSDLRSTAYMAKAKVHEHLDELDSAQIAYSSVLSSFSSGIDSIPANWSLRLLASITDTLGKNDSLMQVYTARVVYDLRRSLSAGGMSKTTIQNNQENKSADNSLTFEGIVPNPTSSECRFALSSTQAGVARLEIVDLTGTVVRQRSVHLNAGSTSIIENVSALPHGMYFVRVTRDEASVTLPLSVNP